MKKGNNSAVENQNRLVLGIHLHAVGMNMGVCRGGGASRSGRGGRGGFVFAVVAKARAGMLFIVVMVTEAMMTVSVR